MLEKTDTKHAPWHVIASDDKRHARLEGLKVVVEALGEGVEIVEQGLDPQVVKDAFRMWGWKPEDAK